VQRIADFSPFSACHETVGIWRHWRTVGIPSNVKRITLLAYFRDRLRGKRG
jgi:hypothetical protein